MTAPPAIQDSRRHVNVAHTLHASAQKTAFSSCRPVHEGPEVASVLPSARGLQDPPNTCGRRATPAADGPPRQPRARAAAGGRWAACAAAGPSQPPAPPAWHPPHCEAPPTTGQPSTY